VKALLAGNDVMLFSQMRFPLAIAEFKKAIEKRDKLPKKKLIAVAARSLEAKYWMGLNKKQDVAIKKS
jgi:hypothetical protein